MFRPLPMAKIRITGLKSDLKRVIGVLYGLKLMHFLDFNKNLFEGLDSGQALEDSVLLSDQQVKVRSIVSFFGLKGKPKRIGSFFSAKEKFIQLFNEFSSKNAELIFLRSRQADLKQKLAEPMAKIFVNEKYLNEFENLVVFSGMVKRPLRQELESNGLAFELIEEKAGSVFVVVLFVQKKDELKARSVLAKCSFVQSVVPVGFSEKKILAELESVSKKIQLIEFFLQDFSKKNAQFFLDYGFLLHELNEKAQVPVRFGVSENAFVATGWVPENRIVLLKEKLSVVAPSLVLEVSGLKNGAPIALENPKALKPFEFFLELYTLPDYKEIDPTFLMAFTFPLFYGFMLGDVGYGIVTLLLFWFLYSKTNGVLKSLSGVLVFASIASIVFGLVFGEFFGYEFIEHPLLNRVHEPNLVLALAVFVGFLHLNLGLLIGFYNELKTHGLKHAFFAKISWIVLEAGFALLAVELLGIAGIGFLPSAVVCLGAVVMLFLGEGAKGIVELPSLFSNMLSYGRLFAVGLSSVSIALVVNQMASQMLSGGIIGIFVAIIVLVTGHVLNIALGVLGPTLHSIRLHYVEFFSKFFHGQGKKYLPFGQTIREEIIE